MMTEQYAALVSILAWHPIRLIPPLCLTIRCLPWKWVDLYWEYILSISVFCVAFLLMCKRIK
jgi:hypothetical protein